MPKKIKNSDTTITKLRPASTPELRENQLVALAVDEAEYQLRNHTASSGVIIHYLKLATQKAKLEEEKLQKDIELQQAKTDAIQGAKDIQELYSNAIAAMKSYSGNDDNSDEENFNY